MRAFHDDSEIQTKYLARVRSHRAADELSRGKGWDGFRGCAIGCTLDAYNHSRYPIELGIPEQLAHLEDWLFEHMPVEDAMAWPERVLSSIHVGSDLSRVWPEFAIWMLTDPEHGVSQYAVNISVRAVIVGVADLYRRTDKVSQDEWAAARVAAWAADSVGDAATLMYAATYAERAAPETWTKAAAAKFITLLESA